MRALLKSLLLLLLLAVAVAASPENAASPKEDPVRNDVVCFVAAGGASECFPRIFVPSAEFQDVRPGQLLPKGLHVRINWQTGTKQARLIQPEQAAAQKEGRHDALVALPDASRASHASDASHAPTGTPIIIRPGASSNQDGSDGDNDDAAAAAFASAFASDSSGLSFQDAQAFADIVADLLSNNRSLTLPALVALEDTVGHIDFGLALARHPTAISTLLDIASGSMDHLDAAAVDDLNKDPLDPESSLAARAALVLGVAMSNNPEAQTIAADRFNLPSRLWTLIEICITHDPTIVESLGTTSSNTDGNTDTNEYNSHKIRQVTPDAAKSEKGSQTLTKPSSNTPIVLQNRLVYAFAASIRSNAQAARAFISPSSRHDDDTAAASNTNNTDGSVSTGHKTADASSSSSDDNTCGLSRMAAVFEHPNTTSRTRRRLLDLVADIVDPLMHPDVQQQQQTQKTIAIKTDRDDIDRDGATRSGAASNTELDPAAVDTWCSIVRGIVNEVDPAIDHSDKASATSMPHKSMATTTPKTSSDAQKSDSGHSDADSFVAATRSGQQQDHDAIRSHASHTLDLLIHRGFCSPANDTVAAS